MKKSSRGRLVITIAEGKRVKIASISYSGNKQIKTDELKKIIKLRKKKFFSGHLFTMRKISRKKLPTSD